MGIRSGRELWQHLCWFDDPHTSKQPTSRRECIGPFQSADNIAVNEPVKLVLLPVNSVIVVVDVLQRAQVRVEQQRRGILTVSLNPLTVVP